VNLVGRDVEHFGFASDSGFHRWDGRRHHILATKTEGIMTLGIFSAQKPWRQLRTVRRPDKIKIYAKS
jgi:hypothetical protein